MTFILFVIFLAFLFDFTNGFHDAANSIATIVATEVLKPWQAVVWAAFFNFIGILFFKLSVANTIGTGLINPEIINAHLIFAALIGAIIWNIITWYHGFPSSSSHALIGALAGAALSKGGPVVLKLSGFTKIVIAIFLSPLIGLVVGLSLASVAAILTKGYANKTKTNQHFFKRLQIISSALLSLTHGGNDAQKTMGIIAVLLYSSSLLGEKFYVPFWVSISCYLVISLGTLSGGWRIVYTMGHKITKLNPLRGACAETSAAIVIFAATDLGIPISTTQTVTGSIAGVGLEHDFFSTNWAMINKLFLTWIITIPATAIISAIIMFLQSIIL